MAITLPTDFGQLDTRFERLAPPATPEVAEFQTFWRRYHRLAAQSTAWSRTGTIVLHYRF